MELKNSLAHLTICWHYVKRKDSKTITLDLSLAEYESLKKIGEKFNITMTQLIRNMIRENIEGKYDTR